MPKSMLKEVFVYQTLSGLVCIGIKSEGSKRANRAYFTMEQAGEISHAINSMINGQTSEVITITQRVEDAAQ